MRSSSIAWTRVAVEAAVIVSSILLALGVDELREARRDRALEREYLTRLLDDLDENAEVLERQRDNETAQIANARVVYPLISRGEMDGVDTMTLVVASYNATPSPTPAWVDDTFEELKTTGRMSLISNATLKGELLAYYRFLEARDYTYQLMSTEYRDALRGKMDADLQLRIRQECRGSGNPVGCAVDIESPDLPSFLDWIAGNEELASGLRKVIVQWTRGQTEYLPEVQERTDGLRRIIEAELER